MIAQIMKADELGVNSADGKWVAFCKTHTTYVNAATKKELLHITTEAFCDCCTGDCTSFCINFEEEGH